MASRSNNNFASITLGTEAATPPCTQTQNEAGPALGVAPRLDLSPARRTSIGLQVIWPCQTASLRLQAAWPQAVQCGCCDSQFAGRKCVLQPETVLESQGLCCDCTFSPCKRFRQCGFSVRHRWTEVGAILPCCTQSQLVDGAMVFGLKVHVIYAVAEGESGTLSILNCMQSDWSEHDRFTDVESRAPVLSWRLKPRSRVVCRDLLTIASTLFFCLGLLALPGRKPTRKLPNPTSQQRLGRSSTR